MSQRARPIPPHLIGKKRPAPPPAPPRPVSRDQQIIIKIIVEKEK